MAQAEIPIASQASLAMVSPTATNDCLTVSVPECGSIFERPAGSSFFRIEARDGLQGTAMADSDGVHQLSRGLDLGQVPGLA